MAYVLATFFVFQLGVIVPVCMPILSAFVTTLIVLAWQAGRDRKEKSLLLNEKSNIEQQLDLISSLLSSKENELGEIQSQLSQIRQENEDRSKSQSEKINHLQEQMSKLVQEKQNLLEKKVALEEKVLGFRVHISIDQPLERDNEEIKKECDACGIITQSPKVLQIFSNLKKIAKTNETVLILGESGTGKELFAKAVHRLSSRSGEFVPLNLNATPETMMEAELFGFEKGAFSGADKPRKGKFLQAKAGTLFLDEIGDLLPSLQVKLLRTLQEKEIIPLGKDIQPIKIDTRIVAATNKNMEKAVGEKEMRLDLYGRLSAFVIELPPLRERPEDIELLSMHFIKQFGSEFKRRNLKGISTGAMKKLKNYPWTGNVRELENVLRKSILLSPAKPSMLQEKDIQFSNLTGTISPDTQQDLSFQEASFQKPDQKKQQNIDDSRFLSVARRNRFVISNMEKELDIDRETIRSQLKGICFQTLVNCGFDVSRTTESLTEDPTLQNKLEEKVDQYMKTLLGNLRKFETLEDAQRAVRDYKIQDNIPSKYRKAIEILIRHSWPGRENDGFSNTH